MVRVTWENVNTLYIHPGQCLTDKDTALAWDKVIPVTFAHLDFGAETSNTSYWLWVYEDDDGATSPLLSLSATTPGTNRAKRRLMWLRNTAHGEIACFTEQIAIPDCVQCRDTGLYDACCRPHRCDCGAYERVKAEDQRRKALREHADNCAEEVLQELARVGLRGINPTWHDLEEKTECWLKARKAVAL